MAVGHTIVELPLIMILSFGLFHFSSTNLEHNTALRIIGIWGGIAVICFSVLQIRTIISTEKKNTTPENPFAARSGYSLSNKPVLAGIVFSLLNPFFLIWWFTVGLKLISDSISLFGILLGSIVIFVVHVWMDYAWLGSTSFLAHKGISILEVRYYKLFLLSLSMLLVVFGLYWMILNAL